MRRRGASKFLVLEAEELFQADHERVAAQRAARSVERRRHSVKQQTTRDALRASHLRAQKSSLAFSALRVQKEGVRAFIRGLFFAGFGFALLATRPARADEPKPPVAHDEGLYPSPSTRTTLVLAGAGATAVWYGAATGMSFLYPDAPGATQLRIPFAGPWLALGHTGCAPNDPGCSTLIVVLRAILTTIDGVGQAGGVAVALEGVFLPTMEQRPEARTWRLPERKQGFEIRPAPIMAGRDGVGLGVIGQF
jgi:hypothetical protein